MILKKDPISQFIKMTTIVILASLILAACQNRAIQSADSLSRQDLKTENTLENPLKNPVPNSIEQINIDNLHTKLPGGRIILTNEDGLTATLTADKSALAKMSIVEIDSQPFPKALHLELGGQVSNLNAVAARIPITATINEGDVLFLSFYMRGLYTEDESGLAGVQTQLKVNPNSKKGTDYRPELASYMSAGSEWKRVYIPFKAGDSLKDGKTTLFFNFGMRPETFEIGGISLVNYGRDVKLEQMPFMKANYVGAEEGAAWRVEAEKRIDEIRKSDLVTTVKDSKGNPVDGAKISVQQKKHAFGFGGVFSSEYLFRDANVKNADKEKYKAIYKQFFNKAVLPNALKWKHYPNFGKFTVPPSIQWLSSNGIPLRGHNLIWADWERVPDGLKAQYEKDPAALRELTIKHVTEYVDRWKGQLTEWDVLNEAYSEHAFMDICGKDIMLDWFKAAREADPNVKLFINDYAILAGMDQAHQNGYYEVIKYLLDNGAPVDGIGMQGHFKDFNSPVDILKRLDRFASFGKEIEITEFDVQTDNSTAQAQFTRDFLTAAFSHPSVSGIVTWSFFGKANSTLVNDDFTIKPNGQVWLDLIYKKWWTSTEGRSDKSGNYTTRGFQGDYEITVEKGGKVQKVNLSLGKEGKAAEVILK